MDRHAALAVTGVVIAMGPLGQRGNLHIIFHQTLLVGNVVLEL